MVDDGVWKLSLARPFLNDPFSKREPLKHIGTCFKLPGICPWVNTQEETGFQFTLNRVPDLVLMQPEVEKRECFPVQANCKNSIAVSKIEGYF